MKNFWGLFKTKGIVVILFLFALFLRLWHLGKQSLWMDEAFSVWLSAQAPADIFKTLETDGHPPLFYLFLHAWMSRGMSAAYLRLPFACVGALCAPLVFWTAKRFASNKVAVAGGFFYAASFAALYSDTQVRMYSPAVFLSLLATLCFFQAYSRPSILRWSLYVLFGGLSLFTQYYTGFVILTHLLVLLIHKRAREALFISVSLLLLFVPWVPYFFSQMLVRLNPRPSLGWNEFLTFSGQIGLYDLVGQGSLNIGITLVCLALVVVGMLRVDPSKKAEKVFFISILPLCALLPAVITVLTPLHVYLFRYAAIFLPYFILLFILGLEALPKKIFAPVLTAVLCANLALWSLFLTGPAFERQSWLAASTFLDSRLASGDTVVVEHFMSLFSLWYYLPHRLEIVYLPKRYAFQVRYPGDVSWIPVNGMTSAVVLRRICAGSKRQWLVLCQEEFEDPEERVPKWFLENQRPSTYIRFPSIKTDQGIEIFCFPKLEAVWRHKSRRVPPLLE